MTINHVEDNALRFRVLNNLRKDPHCLCPLPPMLRIVKVRDHLDVTPDGTRHRSLLSPNTRTGQQPRAAGAAWW